MSNYVNRLTKMLGEVSPGQLGPWSWSGLEEALGVELPADFKEIVAAYAPVQLNGHLILWHPETALFNLMDRVNRNVVAFESIDWQAGTIMFRGEVPRFGGPDGLIPIAGTDRGETIFLCRSGSHPAWHVVGFSADGEHFYEYELSFAEWLYRYLIGEEMIGPGSAVLYPGPLIIEDLPRSPGDRVVKRHGPERGM
ncbi:SMI1/KNR4 family protein [Kitasatospora sp. NPDC058263]